jgi:hypothetical protein
MIDVDCLHWCKRHGHSLLSNPMQTRNHNKSEQKGHPSVSAQNVKELKVVQEEFISRVKKISSLVFFFE